MPGDELPGGMEKYMVNISALGQLENAQTGELLAGGFGLKKQSKSGTQAISLEDFRAWAQDWSRDVAVRIARTLPDTHLADGESQD